MKLRFIQDLIDDMRYRKLHKLPVRHKLYGKIYYPYYNPRHLLDSRENDIYNCNGEKMHTYFLRDEHFAHESVSKSKYFIWDRYNFGLDTHFYSHNSMFETLGNPKKRYGFLIESETIVPNDYEIFKKHKGLEKDFDLIFTYSDKILQTVDNSRFVPFCATVWNSDDIVKDAYKYKTKNISILSSNKTSCNLHKYRLELARKCRREGLADVFGTLDGGAYTKITDTLNDYRYSICIENTISPYFFTERILTAFAAMAVPIYLGATEIGKFFNTDGIIQIDKNSDIEKVLKQCTKEEYERRLPAILDNYERVKKYTGPFDYMYEKYLKQGE